MRVEERGEEGVQTRRGNDDGVEVARWSRAAHSEPMDALNLVIRTIAMVRDDQGADNNRVMRFYRT